MEQREKQAVILKMLLYFAVVLLFFVIEEIPLFNPLWSKPVLVIAVMVSVSMLEGELTGGVMGFIAGLMVDTYASHIFGVASASFAIMGFVCGSLVIYLFQNNMRTAFILTFCCSSIYGIISYYTIYGMWGVEKGDLIFFNFTIPMILVTSLSSFPVYYIVKKIKAGFEGGL